MKEEAEANAEADKIAKEQADKLNAADALIFSTEKQLKEFGEKISADKKAPIEEGLNKLKTAHAAKDFAAMETAQTELQNAWNAASEEMYKETGGQAQDPNAANGGANPNSGDDVTDVDYEEVKDDNK